MILTVRVMRACAGGTFVLEYEGRPAGNRVQSRLLIEKMQDSMDEDGEPLRVYLAKNGIPIEAAYGRCEARD